MPASARTDSIKGAKKASVKQTRLTGVLDDERQLRRGQAQVERVDDAAAKEAGVVELQELVPVERHDREAVAPAHTELAGHAVDQPTDPVPMLGEGGGEIAVEDRSLGRQAVGRGQQVAVVQQFLHAWIIRHRP